MILRAVNRPDYYKAVMQDNGYIIPETLAPTTSEAIFKLSDMYAGQSEQHWSWETWEKDYGRKIVTVVICEINNNAHLTLLDALKSWWYQ